jgi:hypothetical protein
VNGQLRWVNLDDRQGNETRNRPVRLSMRTQADQVWLQMDQVLAVDFGCFHGALDR